MHQAYVLKKTTQCKWGGEVCANGYQAEKLRHSIPLGTTIYWVDVTFDTGYTKENRYCETCHLKLSRQPKQPSMFVEVKE